MVNWHLLNSHLAPLSRCWYIVFMFVASCVLMNNVLFQASLGDEFFHRWMARFRETKSRDEWLKNLVNWMGAWPVMILDIKHGGCTVDGWNPIPNHLGWCWNPINNGINYQPQLVQDFSHQQYEEFFQTTYAKEHINWQGGLLPARCNPLGMEIGLRVRCPTQNPISGS